jgi:hypothetical protein
LDDFGIDRDFNLVIGCLPELKGIVEQAVKGGIQELCPGEVESILGVDLTMASEMKPARKEQRLSYVKASIVDCGSGEISVAIPQKALGGLDSPCGFIQEELGFCHAATGLASF